MSVAGLFPEGEDVELTGITVTQDDSNPAVLGVAHEDPTPKETTRHLRLVLHVHACTCMFQIHRSLVSILTNQFCNDITSSKGDWSVTEMSDLGFTLPVLTSCPNSCPKPCPNFLRIPLCAAGLRLKMWRSPI